MRAAAAGQPEVKLFNPRFEEEFAAGKDYDPDRCAPKACMPGTAALLPYLYLLATGACAHACTPWLRWLPLGVQYQQQGSCCTNHNLSKSA